MDYYEIRVDGHIDNRRSQWFDGLTLTWLPEGETLLAGPVVDQAALHGVLSRIRDLGLTLVSVTRIPTKTDDPADVTQHHLA